VRILHVEKQLSLRAGIGSYVRCLSRIQAAGGHEVGFFTCANGDGEAGAPRFFDFTATRSPRAMLRMIHNEEAAETLADVLRARRYDVAHLHNVYHHLTPSILPVLSNRRIGIVMSVHDYRLACPTKHFLRADGLCTRCLPNRFYHAASPRCAGMGGAALAVESLFQRLFRRYFRWVDLFVCPTRFMREVLLRTGLPASKAVVVPNVIGDCGLAGTAGDEKAPPGGRELLFAGRLSEEKSPQLMLELARRIRSVRVVIAGDGPLRDALHARAADETLDNVTFTAQVDRRALMRLLARATAVVLPSRCMENSPQTMLEAMAAGRCVIVSDHPPLMEWVQDKVTGRVFRSGEAHSLCRVAQEVLGDEAARSRMALAGQRLVTLRHDGQAIARQIDELYEEAIRRCALR